MFCTLKSDIKLTSNIVKSSDKIGPYIPVDLLPSEYLDTRLFDRLTKGHQQQYYKRLFYAKETRDADKRFCELPENADMCKNCPNKDICY